MGCSLLAILSIPSNLTWDPHVTLFFYHLFEQLIDFRSEVVNLEHKKMEFYMSSQILHYKLVECVRSSRKTDEE